MGMPGSRFVLHSKPPVRDRAAPTSFIAADAIIVEQAKDVSNQQHIYASCRLGRKQ
jgi:hypothetical protein